MTMLRHHGRRRLRRRPDPPCHPGLVALWAWVLVEAIRVPDDAEYRAGTKLVWVLVIAITGLIGAAVYLAVGWPIRRPAPQ